MDTLHRHERTERGSAIVIVLVVVMALSTLAVTMIMQGLGENKALKSDVLEASLLQEAENGLQYNYALMETDPLYAVKDTTNYKADTATSMYLGPQRTFSSDGKGEVKIKIDLQYLFGNAPVMFADRANPVEKFDGIKVVVTTDRGGAERKVAAWYRYEMSKDFGGAVISDAIASGASGLAAKDQAMTGDIVFTGNGRGGSQFVVGSLKANGAVRYYLNKNTQTALLSDANASTYLGGWNGTVEQGLGGTPDQIPDYTNPGSATQLFDFNRFYAAAQKGAGQIFTSLASFATAMNAANAAGKPLEGIIVLDLDPAVEGSGPKLKANGASGSNQYNIPGGINIKGTLMFRFKPGTASNYKVFVETGLYINPANLTGFDPATATNYPTGYPPTFSNPSKAPYNVDLTPAYQNFTAESDLPALMFNNGIVDIHGPANISGVVYGPSFVEIESKNGDNQYFNGAIIGGAGVFIEGNSSSGWQFIRYDSNAIKNLETYNNQGKVLTRTGFTVLR